MNATSEEVDFLDEIFFEVQKISKEKLTEEYEKKFTFELSFEEINRKPFPCSLLADSYRHIAKRLERKGVVQFVGLDNYYPEKISFSICLIPQDFLKFYYQKKGMINNLEVKDFSVSLKDCKIRFDDERAIIFINEIPCQLAPHSHEHCLARMMLTQESNAPVQAVDIYEEITGVEMGMRGIKKKLKLVQDAMYSINGKVKEIINTKDILFSSKNKLIIRNF